MRKLTLALFLLASLGSAALAAPTANQQRVDAIWAYAIDRMDRQSNLWFEEGEFPRVVQLLKTMHASHPADYEILTNLGWMLENIEANDEALAYYIGFRRGNPKNPEAAYPEADYYFRKKAYAKIPPILEPTLKLKPHANSFRRLAHAYERLGMLKDSKRVWEQFLKSSPNDAMAKNQLNRVNKKIQEGGSKK